MSARYLSVLILALLVTALQANATGSVATYPWAISDFVENSSGTVIYGTVPSQNSIVEINPTTLSYALIPIGANPTGLALSQNGSTLYVADNGLTSIAVLNTQTNTQASPLQLGSGVNPLDVQVASNGRLWVLTGAQNQFSGMEQISATTGASTGPGLPSTYTFVYGGRIRTSPDGNTLYYGDYGTSPSYEYQINISGTTPTTIWSANLGYNGEDVALSRDGSLVAFGEGGNATNDIIRTGNDSVAGAIGSGENIAFSPDNAFAYASNQFQQGIYIDSLSTYQQTGTINSIGNPQELFVDNTAKYLFSDEVGDTQVYATGRVVVPEPRGAAILGMAGMAMLSLGRKRLDRLSRAATSLGVGQARPPEKQTRDQGDSDVDHG